MRDGTKYHDHVARAMWKGSSGHTSRAGGQGKVLQEKLNVAVRTPFNT
jgi:hypothetical protein